MTVEIHRLRWLEDTGVEFRQGTYTKPLPTLMVIAIAVAPIAIRLYLATVGVYFLLTAMNECIQEVKTHRFSRTKSVCQSLLEKSRRYRDILYKPKVAALPTPEGPDLEMEIEELSDRMGESEEKIRDLEERFDRTLLALYFEALIARSRRRPPPSYEDCMRTQVVRENLDSNSQTQSTGP